VFNWRIIQVLGELIEIRAFELYLFLGSIISNKTIGQKIEIMGEHISNPYNN
jgi:hypothetical protein